MLGYVTRRIFYSGLVILGVMILTFVLFRVAAGDPALVLLGKNPTPREIEGLRNELGSNKPLFFGRWHRTECFTSASFADKSVLPGISMEGRCEFADKSLSMGPGSIRFAKNFDIKSDSVRARVEFKGRLSAGGVSKELPDFGVAEWEFPFPAGEFVLETDSPALVRSVEFFRKAETPWNSQLRDAMSELVSFSGEFPHVSFMNFGKTLLTREPVKEILWRGVFPSLFLMVPIFIGEILFGVILALVSTAFKDSLLDRGVVLLSVAGMSISYLVFIIFGQWYLGYYFNLFPVWGYGDVRHIALPVCIGVASGLGGGVRFYRTVFINELNREYLRTALAKGCGGVSIYLRHLLRNALIPIITRASTELPFLFTGSLLLETFFGIPGLGYAGINALMNADLQMLKALVMLGALIFVVVNLLTDILYAWADPRVRVDQ